MKRRHFLGALGAIAGGSIIKKPRLSWAVPASFEESLKGTVDDQTFWSTIREQFVFPRDYAYLNTGGIGALPSLVMNEVRTSTDQEQLRPRPGHDIKEWNQLKGTVKELFCPDCKIEELAFVSTATEGINIVINGLPLKKNDEIITSVHEHCALHIPLLNKMQRDGVKIRAFKPDFKNGLGNVERIKKLITKRTNLIFISHITCTTGQIFPLKEIGEIARDKGIWFAVDGAQAVGSMPFDLKDSKPDFYTFSGHKWTLGPKRTGVLYVREELLDTLMPITVGAYSDDGYDIFKKEIKLNPTAQRYEYATQNEALFLGFAKGAEFVKTIGLKNIRRHNRTLAEKFYNGLKEIPNVQILSPEEEKYRSSMITFKIKGKDFRKVAGYLTGEKKIRVRVVPEANVNGVRVSFHVYNNEAEVERILKEIKNFIKA